MSISWPRSTEPLKVVAVWASSGVSNLASPSQAAPLILFTLAYSTLPQAEKWVFKLPQSRFAGTPLMWIFVPSFERSSSSTVITPPPRLVPFNMRACCAASEVLKRTSPVARAIVGLAFLAAGTWPPARWPCA